MTQILVTKVTKGPGKVYCLLCLTPWKYVPAHQVELHVFYIVQDQLI